MDRLARNVEDMLRIIREMKDRGVSVQFIKENMSFTAGSDDPRSTLLFTMLSAFLADHWPDWDPRARADHL
jgi:DNA invertase Pin-like site-specific DNA recombinase